MILSELVQPTFKTVVQHFLGYGQFLAAGISRYEQANYLDLFSTPRIPG